MLANNLYVIIFPAKEGNLIKYLDEMPAMIMTLEVR